MDDDEEEGFLGMEPDEEDLRGIGPGGGGGGRELEDPFRGMDPV